MKSQANKKVDEFNATLIQQREDLEASRRNVNKLMDGGSSQEIIKQEELLKEQIKQKVNMNLGSPDLHDKYTLVPKDNPVSRNIELVRLPTTLTFSSEHSTKGWCYSTCHRANGDIPIGCTDGVKIMDKTTMKISPYDLPYKTANAVIEHRHGVYILHKHGTTYKVEILLPSMSSGETLFESENTTNYAAHMAVSDQYVVAYRPNDGTDGELIIYNLCSKELKYQPVDVHHFVTFLENGNLLAASGQRLIKYRIVDGVAVHLWTTELQNINSVCSGPHGLIYGSTQNNTKSIYIISPSGEKLHEFTHDQLPGDYTGQISWRDGQLVVPGWDEKKVCLLKMTP
ncbi:uncharacterized protein [Watersipora subatra]|uniref:uncharacterized protein n=1 Tax=Watersipora subatra TaxID=2589382 RepID=UPI00355AE651